MSKQVTAHHNGLNILHRKQKDIYYLLGRHEGTFDRFEKKFDTCIDKFDSLKVNFDALEVKTKKIEDTIKG